MRKFLLAITLVFSGAAASYAQADSLMAMLDGDKSGSTKEPVTATFKATRIINGSSVENLAMGVLDFRILHRFGRLSEGAENFFGLDDATTRLGLDYGVTKWLMVGIGHNTLKKTNDGFVKARILQQQMKGMPITLSYFGGMGIIGGKAPATPAGTEYFFSNRMSYVHQLLIARKFNERLSLQIMPTLVHQNLVDSTKYSNNTFALGIGGRIKLSRRIALTGEYYYRATESEQLYAGLKTYNSLSLGIDIETGGHVFQLMITNSAGITEKAFITQTTDTWSKGELHFGFNISRVFTVVKPKEFRKGESKSW